MFDYMSPRSDLDPKDSKPIFFKDNLTDDELVSQLVGALSPVNHRGLHWGWTHDDASSY